jgi:hypothetical protein
LGSDGSGEMLISRTTNSRMTLLSVLVFQRFGTVELAAKATDLSPGTLRPCMHYVRGRRLRPRTRKQLETFFEYPAADLLSPASVRMEVTVSRG